MAPFSQELEPLQNPGRFMLAANQSLMTVYVMKAQLKVLWTATTAWDWRGSSGWPTRSKVAPPLIQFARRLSGYWCGIVSRVRWPMHSVRTARRHQQQDQGHQAHGLR